jgi:hypothetical protein
MMWQNPAVHDFGRAVVIATQAVVIATQKGSTAHCGRSAHATAGLSVRAPVRKGLKAHPRKRRDLGDVP